MPWIVRGGNRYYARGERRGRQVRQVYFGTGPVAELAARADELRRAEREARARSWADEEARWRAADALAEKLNNAADLTSEAALTRAGYHRHDRGSWRKRQMGLDDRNTETEAVPAEGVRGVLERAERGDRTALPALRGLLDASPELWRRWGDLAAIARGAWVGVAAGQDLVVAESLTRYVDALKAELAGPAPTPLERLLADRVAAGWLQCHHADAAAAMAGGRELTLAQLDQLQKRQERAQRGYLAAIKALAVVRRLLPTVAKPLELDGSSDAVADEPFRAEGDPPAWPEKARTERAKDGHRRTSKTAVRGRNDSEREAVIPEPLRKRLRGMVGAKN